MASVLSLLIIRIVDRTAWAGGSARRKAATNTGQHKHRINANIHSNPVLERVKTVHALDRAATVMGKYGNPHLAKARAEAESC
jgi:hypothetical protein